MIPSPRTGSAALCLALGTLALAAPAPRPVDLDVSVPAGTPLDWTRAFPSLTPVPGSLFPTTPDAGDPGAAERSSSTPARGGLDVQVNSSLGLVRILTWDLGAHLTWVTTNPTFRRGPLTGRGGNHPPLPVPGDALYWMTVAPLLRMVLHPEAVSSREVLAHLVEVGEPTLGILPAVRAERGLAEQALTLERMIRPLRDGAGGVRAAEDPAEAMALRLVHEELSTKHAYDPVAGFGERMFLFGDGFLPAVIAYTDDANAFVRRNATAALGRYHSKQAVAQLLTLASESDDPVVVVRALAGLARYRGPVDVTPLLKRLAGTKDRVIATSLIHALGRTRAEAAIPQLLVRGEAALKAEDSEPLMSILAALAEMRPRSGREEVLDFADRVATQARKNPLEFRAQVDPAQITADTPDRAEVRAETLEQLTWILRARIDPQDRRAGRDLLALRDNRAPQPEEGRPRFRATGTGDSLDPVHPPVRFLYLATLRELGEEGVEALVEIALDGRSDPSLRGYALAQMPWDDALAAITTILSERRASDEMRIQAFEAAVALKHPELEALGRALIAGHQALPEGGGEPEARYLVLTAVRALSHRGLLGAKDLFPLMRHVKANRNAHDRLPEEVRHGALQLVERASLGAQKVELDRRIDELLDLVAKHDANDALVDKTRKADRRHILALISGATAHRNNGNYLLLVVDEVVAYLLGYAGPKLERTRGEFAPRVQLEEEILLALGRSGDPMALELLVNVLGNRQNRHRAVACLALGVLGRKGAERTLAGFLLDADPFVRYCAHRALLRLTERSGGIDWLAAPSQERAAAAEEVLRWILKR